MRREGCRTGRLGGNRLGDASIARRPRGPSRGGYNTAMERLALLAIDTSTEFCSVAVCVAHTDSAAASTAAPTAVRPSAVSASARAGQTSPGSADVPDPGFAVQSSDDPSSGLRFFSLDIHTGAVSSTYILPAIDAVLDAAGLTLAECGALAFGAGPGSFTGLRTATGIAQGLAFGANLPVVPVDTLMACAESARLRGTIGGARAGGAGTQHVLAAMDARMGECYWEALDWSDREGWQIVVSATVGAPESVVTQWSPTETRSNAAGDAESDVDIAAYAGRDDYAVVGSAVAAFGERISASAAARFVDAEARPSGIAVASIGWRAWQAGQAVPPGQAQPRYIRDKVALTTREREIERSERAERTESAERTKRAERLANP